MAKKSKALSRWSITLLVGYIEAADQKAAIEAAAKEFKIAEAVRDRIVARREERFWAASMIWADTLAIGLLVIATIVLAIAAPPSAGLLRWRSSSFSHYGCSCALLIGLCGYSAQRGRKSSGAIRA